MVGEDGEEDEDEDAYPFPVGDKGKSSGDLQLALDGLGESRLVPVANSDQTRIFGGERRRIQFARSEDTHSQGNGS